jgi:hypothetical protein
LREALLRYKRKLIILFILIIALMVLQYALKNPALLEIYNAYVFHPYQCFRNFLFKFIPLSVGDILYAAAILSLIVLPVRWVYFLIRFGKHKRDLADSVIYTLITFCSVYIYFLIAWGANYYKPTLSSFWHLAKPKSRTEDSAAIVSFDQYLLDKLNAYAPHYHSEPFKEINKKSIAYYSAYTDYKNKLQGLKVKRSLFGRLIQHLEIEGYYNPFTGESQINEHLPAFIMPFVVCHEMAHQAGIAAEGDANLLAYAIGTSANDSSFNYSSYLNIWFYTQSRLNRRNHVLAKQLEAQLNDLTKAQIDTLERIRKQYVSDFSRYSSDLYDNYLRMHQQKEGIHSYGNVASSAWAWEQRRKVIPDSLIAIP